MGFFSDLKEDLSQAVNELMPGEEAVNTQDGQAEETLSLDEMLKNIDSIQLPLEEDVPEESKDAVEETVTMDVNDESVEDEIVADVEMAADIAPEVSASENDFADAENTNDEQTEWDLESMLENALAEETVQTVENTEEYKGAGTTMEMSANRTVSDETSVITAGMSITGDIVSEGSLDLVGRVAGNIDVLGKLNITGHINGNSKAAEIYAEGAKITGEIVSEGAVKIGASTVIVGNITATSAAIAGAVKGDIDVRGPVVLDASAIVMGNIKSKSVQINNGAVIEGMCSQCYADVSPTSFFEDYKMEMKKDKSK